MKIATQFYKALKNPNYFYIKPKKSFKKYTFTKAKKHPQRCKWHPSTNTEFHIGIQKYTNNVKIKIYTFHPFTLQNLTTQIKHTHTAENVLSFSIDFPLTFH